MLIYSTAASERFGTVWKFDEHTRAKHAILTDYWNRWLPILGRYHNGLNYIDGFAGPGESSDGEPGSPVLVLTAALGHTHAPKGNVSFTFIEKQNDRAEHLKAVLAKQFPQGSLRKGWVYSVDQGEFETVLNGAIDDIEKRGNRLAPTFAFLDPFGFTGFPMKSIARLLAFERCEVLVTFMDGFAKRFLDELRADSLDSLFGSPDWKGAQRLTGDERTALLVGLYDRQLRSDAGAKFVRSFEMRDSNDRVIYHLFFATRHPEGLRQMKEAMWTVDRRGTYRFSDVTGASQRFLLDYLVEDTPEWVDAAGRMVFEHFRGQEVPAPRVREFVELETPYVYRATVLRPLEADGRIATILGRGKGGGYGDRCVLRFKS